jgi:hypothetical protein
MAREPLVDSDGTSAEYYRQLSAYGDIVAFAMPKKTWVWGSTG